MPSPGGPSLPEDPDVVATYASTEKKYEERALRAEEKLNEVQNRLSQQRYELRQSAFSLAQGVVYALGIFLAIAAFCILDSNAETVSETAQAAMIVGPIAAIATVTVFILIGVFRGFKDKDGSILPTTEAVAQATDQL